MERTHPEESEHRITAKEAQKRRAEIALDNFLRNITDLRRGSPTFLRPQQIHVLLRFAAGIEENLQEDPAGYPVPSKGYGDIPGGFGKTAIMAGMLEAFNVGQQTPWGPLRALVTTKGIDATVQTAGELAKFIPDIQIGLYRGNPRDLDATVTVTNYELMRGHHKRGAFSRLDYVAWLADEPQHLLSPDFSRIAPGLAARQPSFGLTATPEMGDGRHIRSLFEHELYQMTPYEAAKQGYIRPVKLYGVMTRKEIIVDSLTGDFTESELSPLIYDSERNAAIVATCLDMLQRGRKVMIFCVEGGASAHARLLADILNKQRVNGQLVRAAAVGEFLPSAERFHLIRRIKDNEFDVMTQTYLAEEAFNWPRASGIILARMTESPRRAKQRPSRAHRFDGLFEYAELVEFYDDIRLRGGDRISFTELFQKMYTLWDVYDITRPKQGQLVAPDRLARRMGTPNRHSPRSSYSTVPSVHDMSMWEEGASKRLRNHAGAGLEGMLLDFTANIREVTIRRPRSEPSGWVSLPPYNRMLAQRAGVRDRFDVPAIRHILQEGGFGDEHITMRGREYKISPDAAGYLDQYAFPDIAPSGSMPTEELRLIGRVGIGKVLEALNRANIPVQQFRHPVTHHVGRYVLAEYAEIAKKEVLGLTASDEDTAGLETITDMARRNNQKDVTVRSFVNNFYKAITPVQLTKLGTKRAGYYPHSLGQIVDYHYDVEILTETETTIEEVLSAVKNASDFLRFLRAREYVADRFTAGRVLSKKEKGKKAYWIYTLKCARTDARRFKEEFRIYEETGGAETIVPQPIALHQLAVEMRSDSMATNYLLKQVGERKAARTGRPETITRAAAEAFREACAVCPQAGLLDYSAYQMVDTITKQGYAAVSVQFIWAIASRLGYLGEVQWTAGSSPFLTPHYTESQAKRIRGLAIEQLRADTVRKQ